MPTPKLERIMHKLLFSFFFYELEFIYVGEKPSEQGENQQKNALPRSHWWDASTRHLLLHVSKECYCFSHRYGTAKHEDLTKESG